ncbi:MAG: isoprenylcysteine carboxylmethyltransferase family protein [Caulobacterales bacterium]|nr:isoprenylcysteine carboxylmethyltransferase family protein [Caulobacterales bacterium]
MSQSSPSPDRDHPGVIAPPPLIYFGFLLLGWVLDAQVLHLRMPFDLTLPVKIGAVVLILVGLGLEMWAGGLFRRAGTNVVPWSPSTALVASGPYRFSRNPMYVGFTLVYLGLALGLQSPSALILLLPCLALMTWGVILREERYLAARFGQAYLDYKDRVRRWL